MSHVFSVAPSIIPTVPRAMTTASRQRVDSRELLQGEREVIIQHGDQEYRLRHTQNDKLILTK
ncbi:hemin uptake protein HemP [Chiayiivirga flava]|uniref:Hemin uptake protein HemP n=1 Tax=Chiayiivirga flava TaxID=659595 RepID=A0A7W8G2K2_9GAMM|nr:hemin uptake protein HemP [Chiayiivirga flava]